MVPRKYTFMQSDLIDVKMCTFSQKHCIFEIKILYQLRANRQAPCWSPPLSLSLPTSCQERVPHPSSGRAVSQQEGKSTPPACLS